MHQRRWLELLANYDLDFTYHEGKSSLVPDALSRKTTHFVNALTGSDELIRDLAKLKAQVREDQGEGFSIHEDGSLRFNGS